MEAKNENEKTSSCDAVQLTVRPDNAETKNKFEKPEQY